MPLIVPSRDVLDATHEIVKPLKSSKIGYFRRIGPNAWDDYLYVEEAGGELELLPGVPVQLESRGAELRVRSEGRVARVRWEADAELAASFDELTPKDRRARFVSTYLRELGAESVLGAGGVIARTLTER